MAMSYYIRLLIYGIILWRKAVFDWYTVKGSDSSEGQKERDLLQEHDNLATKHIHNGQLLHFDLKFM